MNEGPSQSGLIRPGAGSEYVYRIMTWDTLGNLSQDMIDTEVVFKSGISYQGKDNVVVTSYKYDTALNYAIYHNYDSNGDIEEYFDISAPYGWRTYPIASHGTAVFRDFKFTYVKDSTILEANRLLDAADIQISSDEDYWVAPSIGEMVRIVTIAHSPYIQNYSRFEWHLVSYTLK